MKTILKSSENLFSLFPSLARIYIPLIYLPCHSNFFFEAMSKAKVLSKVKYSVEFQVKSSPRILYNHLSTPDGLEGWFADKVTINNGDYVFHWGNTEQRARQMSKRDNQMVRYKWITEDHKDETYFQFDIVEDGITGDIALVVTDFTTEDEREQNTRLWSSQVHELMHSIGS